MKIRIALLMALLVIPLSSHAQAFKCRTPSGKMEFSDSPCAGGAQTERVQSNEYISPERQRQAREVQARNAAQIQGMEAENAAFKQQQQRQHASQAAADQRQAVTDQLGALEKARAKSAEANGRCIETATNRRNSAMLAECKGISKVQAQNELDAPLTDNQPLPAYEQPMPVVKSCNGNSCRDQYGNRYIPTAVPGKFDRSDGKRCKQIGKSMSCV
ncbi:MAG: DUF4124 domain-containing protein [Dechloromonas sp.]|nr:DUF4124 domain-containing protein [Dechloromonas sp.]